MLPLEWWTVYAATMTARTHHTSGVQRLDYKSAEAMLRAGATQQEVADHFGVTQGAVHMAIKRGNIKHDYDRTYKSESGLPWHPIRPEHRNKHLARMLRAAARRQQGKSNAAVLEAQLDSFLASMEEGGWVVHYDPDTAEGFWRVLRRPGIDKGFVREPDANGR